ncbi:MAG: hypothetical protein KH366_11680 [Clostridiaceae bacterium]|nr:hypothetical protein [Clostridiaceae bacterium]
MKKVKIALAASALAVILAACGGKQGSTSTFSPDQDSIFVSREGSFSSSLVETYDSANYTQEKFQTFVDDIVSSYNEGKGAGALSANAEGQAKLPVAVKSCILEGGAAKIIFDYASGADLIEFAKDQQDADNLAEGLEFGKASTFLNQGALMEAVFVTPKDGTNVKPEKLVKAGESSCVAVDGAVTIQTEGKIQYVSKGVSLQDDFTAKTPEGRSYIIFK